MKSLMVLANHTLAMSEEKGASILQTWYS